MQVLANNVHDVALIFEGGGMRNSYSSAVVTVLLEQGIHINAVYGVSAGAANAINYLSRDKDRSRLTFTEYDEGLPFKKVFLYALRHGLFGSHTLQSGNAATGKTSFDFETFHANPARLTLEGIERDSGKTKYWTRGDFGTEHDLMMRVQAALSYPLIMPPMRLAEEPGCVYYDGGPGEGGGIMVPQASRDGFEKFFVVCTQPKGFRKNTNPKLLYNLFFWRRPLMRQAMNSWARRYNEQLDNLARLQESGRAYVYYATDQMVTNHELDTQRLKENYRLSYNQAQRELDDWIAFLGL